MKLITMIVGLMIGFSAQAEEMMTYDVTFITLWNKTDHVRVPGNAHFSPIVAVSHNDEYRFLTIGEKVTPGMELLAELGRSSTINSEINEQKNNNTVLQSVESADLFLNRETEVSFTISVSSKKPLLSFATMIAPSPDWVVGVDALPLFVDGEFVKDTIEMDLYALNAGTENGDFAGNYSINNSASRPHMPMSLLTGPGFDAPFAKVSIKLKD